MKDNICMGESHHFSPLILLVLGEREGSPRKSTRASLSLSLSLPWLRSLSGLHDWRFFALTPCGRDVGERCTRCGAYFVLQLATFGLD